MRITVLAGGVGGAKFLTGVRQFATSNGRDDSVTAIVNTGDDITLHGLRICPDVDSVMYTLGGVIDSERGWGRAGETWRIKEALAEYGVEPTWFGLGDLDIATHLVRTEMLAAGYPLSDVISALCTRWKTGIRILPMSDDRCETHVVVERDGTRKAIHLQEWWVRYRAQLPALGFVQVGLEDTKPAPGVLEAIADAELLLIAPSNPVVSVDTILNVPGIRQALHDSTVPVVGVSPIIGGAPVRGMADACLPAVGVRTSAAGVAGFYGSRTGSAEGILDAFLVHFGDAFGQPGLVVHERDIVMHDATATAGFVADALRLAAEG